MKPGTGPPAPGDDGLNTRFQFDRIVVDAAAHTLLRDGEPQPLEPKAFAVLLALLRRPGELLGRDELLDQVIESIEESANTGKIGDGKIFVFDLEQAIRIRTGETGAEAL